MVTGHDPKGEIDHKDRNKLNNRMSNLREATRTQNVCNVGIRSDCTSGVIGVSWYKYTGRWKVQIQANKRKLHLGYYLSKPLAAGVSKKARQLRDSGQPVSKAIVLKALKVTPK